MLKFLPLLLTLVTFVWATPAQMETMLKKAKSSLATQVSLDSEREARFKSSLKAQKALLAQAKSELKALKKESVKLNNTIDINEKTLQKLEEKLHIRSGNLGELKGIVKQMSSDLYGTMKYAPTALIYPKRITFLEKISESKRLPNSQTLSELWMTVLEELSLGGMVQKISMPMVLANGEAQKDDLLFVGPFTYIAGKNFFVLDSENGVFGELGKQPGGYLNSVAEDAYESKESMIEAIIDPTRGELLSLTTVAPTISERVAQGATIGYIILGLGLLGLIFALYKGVRLFIMDIAIHKNKAESPMHQLETHYNQHNTLSLVQLELSLESYLSKVKVKIESGLSILKLLASVAPLLGLLGTVTGMIATFSAITLFGTGDPKLMAGGISQALVTTVEGLVVAIPLLFAYTLLHTRTKEVLAKLDEASLELLSKHKESK